MAGWDGNGAFTRTHNWVADKDAGVKIVASRHDANDQDFVDGINNCLTIDGQNVATANLPMATFKHTGVGIATASTDYLRADQAQTNNLTHYTATGTDTYAITPSPAVASYAAGQKWSVLFTNANTGAATLNVNALGAKAIEDQNGNALASGAITAGAVVDCVYDGTNFQIVPTVVPTTSIADNAITLAKMAGGTDGNLITFDASGDPAYVATGTSGQLLTSNGAGAAPTMQAPTYDKELISTATASSDASVAFTGLSSTYFTYIVEIEGVQPATDGATLLMRTDSNGGASYDAGASDYAWAVMNCRDDGTTSGVGDTADSSIPLNRVSQGNNGAVERDSHTVTIYNPSSTNYTQIRIDGWLCNNSVTPFRYISTTGGQRISAAAVDAIQFIYSSGNIAVGEFRLYGLRGA